MNIVFVSRFYRSHNGGGGISAYTHYAALALARTGNHIKVISALADGYKVRETVNGVDVIRFPPPLRSYYWTRLPLFGRQVRFLRDLVYAWNVRQTLLRLNDEFRPDIVEYADIDAEGLFHPVQLFPYVVKLHTPHIVLSDYYSKKEAPYARKGIEWVEAKAILNAAGISSPSLNLAEEIEKRMNVAHGRIKFVPNFIDTDAFYPLPDGSKEQTLSVLYVGRLESLKGAPIFAQAIPQIAHAVPQAKFIFLGADRASKNGHSQLAELQQFFVQAGLSDRVEFHGNASSEVFLSFYQRASIFVLPSLFENSPYTLLEAMACGKACVVSSVGGITQMLDDGESCLFFSSGNSTELAEKVIRLLKNPQLCAALGYSARQRALKDFSLEVGAEKTAVFYTSVIQKENLCES